MARIVLVGKRNDDLIKQVQALLPTAIYEPSFHFKLQAQDVICWLPMPSDLVDQDVYELVSLIDDTEIDPRKIVMLSIPGTADDATNDDLKRWYGKKAPEMALAHQYAIKMIDELEFPYVIIRALPIVSRETDLKIVSEGQQLTGEAVGEAQVAQVIKTALTTDQYRNQSIGLQA